MRAVETLQVSLRIIRFFPAGPHHIKDIPYSSLTVLEVFDWSNRPAQRHNLGTSVRDSFQDFE
jgi:hypothetical protein